jgi:uncharacterized protein involved in type VI secretion and phage assembly
MNLNDQLLSDLAERIQHRYYGKYRGVVTQVDGETMRLKAKVPAVLREQESGWAMPCVPYAGPQVGVAFLPEAGSGVWIEFEGGNVSCPIWTGCYWRKGEFPPEAKADVKAIVTKKTKIVFDDSAPSVTCSDTNENMLTLDSDGVAMERGGKNLKITTSKVAVNDGALEVT